MNYDEMSDFEINHKVAIAVKVNYMVDHKAKTIKNSEYSAFYGHRSIDYCNNPSDAWPIVVENKINIQFRDGKTSLIGAYGECQYECEYGVELRAAMICFLKMKESETK